MDINESLFQAITLFGLGMAFVFSFLGLLLIAVKLMAKFIPADAPVISQRAKNNKVAPATTSKSEINPQVIAAITSAVQQYRKAELA
ncbi:oxaloacetate decarboxylase subunit gamma [Psychromonas sp. psych-6C06]|uniref:oxaloacetate decarboxylase subunit gamma n=1 Tax=Psychromonas sp. psych-6C06 TaxID=2058089 RepID=UPI000C348C3E|nr:oxaloacetate decarboxylase subunit gamma [Psychromonas sp. psych-6C06]PKF60220.1 oxaloacetate decarboxylase subunit gamma [Psychromonas sp. psych-6C06]